MQLGETQATPQDLCLGLLVALGVLTIVRDLLAAAERLRLARELHTDPESPAKAAEEILRQHEEERDGREQ